MCRQRRAHCTDNRRLLSYCITHVQPGLHVCQRAVVACTHMADHLTHMCARRLAKSGHAAKAPGCHHTPPKSCARTYHGRIALKHLGCKAPIKITAVTRSCPRSPCQRKCRRCFVRLCAESTVHLGKTKQRRGARCTYNKEQAAGEDNARAGVLEHKPIFALELVLLKAPPLAEILHSARTYVHAFRARHRGAGNRLRHRLRL
jgi:hypothetical protein